MTPSSSDGEAASADDAPSIIHANPAEIDQLPVIVQAGHARVLISQALQGLSLGNSEAVVNRIMRRSIVDQFRCAHDVALLTRFHTAAVQSLAQDCDPCLDDPYDGEVRNGAHGVLVVSLASAPVGGTIDSSPVGRILTGIHF